MGPACSFVLPPIPDENRLPEYHHKHVRDTPTQINGCMMEIDDLQPRIQIKKVVKEDDLSSDNEESMEIVKEDDLSLDNNESMEEFSKSYIVERPLVINCLKQAQKRITSIRTKVCFRS